MDATSVARYGLLNVINLTILHVQELLRKI
jgi:hypothetical protein